MPMMWKGQEVKWRGIDTVPYRDGLLSRMVPRPGSRDGSKEFELAVIEDSWEEPRNLREYLGKPIDRGMKNWPSVILFYTRVSCNLAGCVSIFWVSFQDWICAICALVGSFLGSFFFRYLVAPERSFGSFGVYWEEATTIFEKSQVMRASRPFIEVGDDLMVIIIYLCFIRIRMSWYDWSIEDLYPYVFFCLMVCCTFLRDVMWTQGQYARKRQIFLGREPEYERIVRERALQLLEISEPALPGCSVSHSADLRWARSLMLRKGFQAEIDFIFGVLQEILKEEGCQQGERLFERWHKLHAALVVQQELVHLTKDGTSPISGRQRQTLQKVKSHCAAEMDKLRVLVADLTHGDSDASIVRALLEHQHTQGNVAPAVAAERPNKSAAQPKSTRRNTAQNRGKHIAARSSGEAANARSRAVALSSGESSQHIDATITSSSEGSLEMSSTKASVVDAKEDPVAEQKTYCVCCFDEEAIHVFKTCGHLIYCESCLKWAEAECRRGKLLARIPLKCPLCRSESRVVHVERFEGKLYS